MFSDQRKKEGKMGFFRTAARAIDAYQPQAIVGRLVRGEKVAVDLDEESIIDSASNYLTGGATVTAVAGGVLLGVGASNVPWNEISNNVNPGKIPTDEPPIEPDPEKSILSKDNLTIAGGAITVLASIIALAKS